MTATQEPHYTLTGAGELRTTRFSDVCGGTDEFKRVLTEEPELAQSPEGRSALQGLMDDGLYMLARMEVRLREYQALRDELERLVQEMRAIEEPRLRDAQQEATAIRQLLAQDKDLPASELIDRAEEIRQVANDMEGALRRHKEAAIAAGRAYLSLKGARGWDDGSTGATASRNQADGEVKPTDQSLPPGVSEAWLPPSPHREKVIDWLHRGRAALLTEEEAAKIPVGPQGREPLVQFEDGGVMPLRAVRWSDEVSNFYPLGSPPPHPRGRLYRNRNASPSPA